MHMAGRDLVEAWDIRPDSRRLGSGADEVTHEHRILFVEAMVELHHSVEAVVLVLTVSKVVIGRRRAGADTGRPDRQQVQRDWIYRDVIPGQNALRLRHP